jgi:hypothetical protein
MKKQGKLIFSYGEWWLVNEETVTGKTPNYIEYKGKEYTCVASTYAIEGLCMLDKAQIEDIDTEARADDYSSDLDLNFIEPEEARVAFIDGFKEAVKLNEGKVFTMEQALALAKYGYEYNQESQFPENKFEDECINNTKQFISGDADFKKLGLLNTEEYDVEYEEPTWIKIGSNTNIITNFKKISK